MDVTQLAERSLLPPDDAGSNPGNRIFYIKNLLTVKKMKIEKKGL